MRIDFVAFLFIFYSNQFYVCIIFDCNICKAEPWCNKCAGALLKFSFTIQCTSCYRSFHL